MTATVTTTRSNRVGSKCTLQTRAGHCPTHGTVQATRNMPTLRFPILVTGPIRLAALTRPYRCPDCGAATTKA
jgi:hypothetical protein